MTKKRETRQPAQRGWSETLFRLLVAVGGISASAYQFARNLSLENRTILSLVIAAAALTLTAWMVLRVLESGNRHTTRSED